MKKMTKTEAELVIATLNLGTRELALDKLVEIDVAKRDETERAPSRRIHAFKSHALLLNAIANADLDAVDVTLARAAAALMTPADRAALRKGG